MHTYAEIEQPRLCPGPARRPSEAEDDNHEYEVSLLAEAEGLLVSQSATQAGEKPIDSKTVYYAVREAAQRAGIKKKVAPRLLLSPRV